MKDLPSTLLLLADTKDETASETSEQNVSASQVTKELVEDSETTYGVENTTMPQHLHQYVGRFHWEIWVGGSVTRLADISSVGCVAIVCILGST